MSIISLSDEDRVVGAAPAADGLELVFVTQNAQLLHYPAAVVRTQGPGAGGVAGIKLAEGDSVIGFFSVAPESSVVVTVSNPGSTLTGTDPGRAKISPLTEFPGKGRATGGVRAHGFLKGEIGLALAFVGENPVAVASDGSPRELPIESGKRDGSGTPLADVVSLIGEPLR